MSNDSSSSSRKRARLSLFELVNDDEDRRAGEPGASGETRLREGTSSWRGGGVDSNSAVTSFLYGSSRDAGLLIDEENLPDLGEDDEEEEDCFDDDDDGCYDDDATDDEDDDDDDEEMTTSSPPPFWTMPAAGLLLSSSSPPPAFLCPLTLKIMFDPVLDAQGHSFERSALLEWLQDRDISPISRKPLKNAPPQLIRNHALRDIIHSFMGKQWVKRKTREEEQQQQQELVVSSRGCCNSKAVAATTKREDAPAPLAATTTTTTGVRTAGTEEEEDSSSLRRSFATSSVVQGAAATRPAGQGARTGAATAAICPHRARMNELLLQSSSASTGGLRLLQLNERGITSFRSHQQQYDNSLTVVLHVPERVGIFTLYTRNLLNNITTTTDAIKTRMLELNLLQAETRGGCLAVVQQQQEQERPLQQQQQVVVFSYTDRVGEVSTEEFGNILVNFVETALHLRSQLMQLATPRVPELVDDEDEDDE